MQFDFKRIIWQTIVLKISLNYWASDQGKDLIHYFWHGSDLKPIAVRSLFC
jgi:hypothetical protein